MCLKTPSFPLLSPWPWKGLFSMYIFMFMIFPVTLVILPSIIFRVLSKIALSAVTGTASSDMWAVVYSRGTSPYATQQCENMKRHIRVIGAFPAHFAVHNHYLGASLEELFRSKKWREGGQSGKWLCCQQPIEQAQNSRTCSSLKNIRCCQKSITPSHKSVTNLDYHNTLSPLCFHWKNKKHSFSIYGHMHFSPLWYLQMKKLLLGWNFMISFVVLPSAYGYSWGSKASMLQPWISSEVIVKLRLGEFFYFGVNQWTEVDRYKIASTWIDWVHFSVHQWKNPAVEYIHNFNKETA